AISSLKIRLPPEFQNPHRIKRLYMKPCSPQISRCQWAECGRYPAEGLRGYASSIHPTVLPESAKKIPGENGRRTMVSKRYNGRPRGASSHESAAESPGYKN